MRRSSRVSRYGQTVVVVAVALGVAAAPAAAVPGLQRVDAESLRNSKSPKTAVAYCPANQRVIGGGGSVQEIDDGFPQTVLTQLRPVRLHDGGLRDAYVVTGAEIAGGTSEHWRVSAYAMCANPWADIDIVPKRTASSSQPVHATQAKCPAGTRVIGTGGRILARAVQDVVQGRIVLQVARPSRPGDIARVRAHEGADGYPGRWRATAYAVCAPPPAGYRVQFSSVRFDDASIPGFPFGVFKRAGDLADETCPAGTRLHSSGAAVGSDAPGDISLSRIIPYPGPRRTIARASENTPIAANWGLVATRTCAS